MDPEPILSEVDGVPWETRPTWLAGNYWWRIYVDGRPKGLLRDLQEAIHCAETLAADEARFRHEAGATQ